MSEKPLVTIGLPVYNSEKYLPQSIESLLGQTYSDFVLLISDNASTDSTADICASYAAQDSRVKYCRNEENIGNPRNFNPVFDLTSYSRITGKICIRTTELLAILLGMLSVII